MSLTPAFALFCEWPFSFAVVCRVEARASALRRLNVGSPVVLYLPEPLLERDFHKAADVKMASVLRNALGS